MKKALTPLLVVAVIVLAAIVLNPSPERHREKIREAIAQRSPIAGALGLGSIAAMVTNYHSLGVASYTKAGDKTLSVGAFGLVFVNN
ncbi:MAG TPA: hypothetical protein VF522_06990 [Ramlibacter sp.]|uniref:hypothetical protein n=1 Tax=Ramlibacter sp. TaxID=1917967 RepID=UPI002ED0FE2F